MLAKILFNSKSLKLCRPAKRSMSGYGHGSPAIRKPELNDVIPTESFQSGYSRRQVGNNFVLIAGTTFFALTATYVLNSGVLFFNLTPPKKNLGEF
ncbi:uncharacterized protein [Parasteatoda tepidariorum]|uniref:uncharacterized protein n=1 Tax=Parasteatoda tepidariorum TaxID=114398 RepID=UPI0039BC3546